MNNCKIIYSILENSGGLISSTIHGIVFATVFVGIYLVVFFTTDDFLKRTFSSFMIAWGLYMTISFSFHSASKYLSFPLIHSLRNFKTLLDV